MVCDIKIVFLERADLKWIGCVIRSIAAVCVDASRIKELVASKGCKYTQTAAEASRIEQTGEYSIVTSSNMLLNYRPGLVV